MNLLDAYTDFATDDERRVGTVDALGNPTLSAFQLATHFGRAVTLTEPDSRTRFLTVTIEFHED